MKTKNVQGKVRINYTLESLFSIIRTKFKKQEKQIEFLNGLLDKRESEIKTLKGET